PNNIGVLVSDTRNVTIQNGTITGFQYGIFLYNGTANPNNSAGHIVESMRITHSGAMGIWVYFMTGCSIHDNYINAFGDSNPSNLGIRVYGVGNQVIRNQVLNCNGPGISTQGGNYLESNFVWNCPIGFQMTLADKYRFNTTIGCA